MTLAEWCSREGKGAVTRLQKVTGLTFATISRIRDGKARARPETARLISRATGGRVSVEDICGSEAA